MGYQDAFCQKPLVCSTAEFKSVTFKSQILFSKALEIGIIPDELVFEEAIFSENTKVFIGQRLTLWLICANQLQGCRLTPVLI